MKTLTTALIALLAMAGAAVAQTPAPQRLTPTDAPTGKPLATVDLGAEFPQMKGYVFTQTLNTIAPGTGRAWHSHANNPEIVHILSGTLTEARNGGPPVAYGPGSTLVNAGGIQHMWANLGAEPVVFMAAAIKKAP